MPEALACFSVLIVCVGVFVYAKIQSVSPANRNPVAEAATLDREIAWITERLELAQKENWTPDMCEALEERLQETRTLRASLQVSR